jgi:hypothetical protein
VSRVAGRFDVPAGYLFIPEACPSSWTLGWPAPDRAEFAAEVVRFLED